MSVAPRCSSASRVIARYCSVIRSPSAGFHLSSCAMFPWTTATRTDSPCDVSGEARRRALPHNAIAPIRTTAPAAGAHLATPRSRTTAAAAAAGQRQKPRQPVDADDTRRLRDRQQRHLAVAEKRPRESVPDVLPPQLRRHPGEGNDKQRRGAPGATRPRHDQQRRWQERGTDRRPAWRRRRRQPESPTRRTWSSSR